jgi:hypothetical protein
MIQKCAGIEMNPYRSFIGLSLHVAGMNQSMCILLSKTVQKKKTRFLSTVHSGMCATVLADNGHPPTPFFFFKEG